VIDFDVVVEQHVKDGFAFGRVFDDCAFGAERSVGEYGDFWHFYLFFKWLRFVCFQTA